MVDVVDKATRSRMMSSIKSKNTKPERLVREHLHRAGFRYRLQVKNLPGKPDLVLPKYRAVICVHGCFWHAHRCDYFRLPASNRAFWTQKLGGNVVRDKLNAIRLRRLGWRLLVVWECAVRASTLSGSTALYRMATKWLRSSQESYLELRGNSGHAISGRRSTARAL